MTARMTMPDFFIAGVAKAGTTSMHAALARHPQLFLSRVKEPKFFLSDGPPPRSGGPGDVQTYGEHVWRRENYEALFAPAPAGTLRGEATPFYLYDLAAQQRIAREVPDAKLILMLRDPVDRAHSNWAHLWGAGLEKEGDFLTACRLEDARRAAGWADFWHYIAQGRYGEQIENLFTLFPKEQVLILRYRDLRDEPLTTLNTVCSFLGVDRGYDLSVPRENVSPYVEATAVNAVLRALLRNGAKVGHRFPVVARKAARGPILTVLQRHRGARPVVSPEHRAALLPEFIDDVRRLEAVTGESYADWLKGGDLPRRTDET